MTRDRSRSRRPTAPSSDVASTAHTASTADAPSLVGAFVGYRLLRRIAAGERADVYLATADLPGASDPRDPYSFAPPVVDGSGRSGTGPASASPPLVVVRVYPRDASAESVALEIEAMSTDAGGALPALYDVAALDDGRCCLAVERIGGVAVSRLLTERMLTAGEAVTILAPIVVAVAELAAHGFVHTRLAASDILLDDAGRPRLVGLGALRRLPGHEQSAERTALLRSGHVALAELLEDVCGAVRPAGVLDDAVDLIRGRLEVRPFEQCEADLERRLFAVAAAEPIAGVEVRMRTVRLPARIGTPAAAPDITDDHGRASDGDRPTRGRRTRALLGLAQLPEDLGERLATAADAVPGARLRTRLGSMMRSKRRALMVGGLIGGGALVLMLTMVPPGTETEVRQSLEPGASAITGPASPSEGGPQSAVGAPPPIADGVQTGAAGDDDPVAATRWLLERRSRCFETLDLGCLDAVVQPTSAIEAQDRAAMLAARDGATHVDDGFDLTTLEVRAEMGDAVLVGMTGAGPRREPASLLVVRGEAGWRLREIFD
ncbi:hypothetical protein ACFWN7_00180 [Agromyces sp. NPDC058484]|uniref:hypothetical protein n=1 Tax=Agromyces sp. NPDC058484 TaxID=3346524 RepID=UPI0036555235